MVRSTVRRVVVALAFTALSLATPAEPARAQGADLAAAGASASSALDLGAWSQLAGWLTDLWNSGLELFVASDAAPTPPASSSCTGDCDRGGGIDPNG